MIDSHIPRFSTFNWLCRQSILLVNLRERERKMFELFLVRCPNQSDFRQNRNACTWVKMLDVFAHCMFRWEFNHESFFFFDEIELSAQMTNPQTSDLFISTLNESIRSEAHEWKHMIDWAENGTSVVLALIEVNVVAERNLEGNETSSSLCTGEWLRRPEEEDCQLNLRIEANGSS
jgi:hypothetical protein